MALRRVLLLVAAVTPLAPLAAVPLQECDSTDTCAPFEEADSAAMLQTKSLASQEQASTEKIPNPDYAPKLVKGMYTDTGQVEASPIHVTQPIRDPSREGCCKASIAACFACQADTTETYWCAFYPSTEDCPKKLVVDPSPAGCCKAATANCFACQAGTTVTVWCASYPSTESCPKEVKEDVSWSLNIPGIGDLSKLNPFGQYR